MARIHPTAIVEPGAEFPPETVVGAYAYVGGQVKLGSGCVVANHAIVQGRTTTGNNFHVHPGAVVGGTPQDLKYHGEPSELIIGDHNVFREHCTVHIGTETGGMVTRIGSGNLFMAGVHIAHDCTIGDGVILANLATLGGHVAIEDGARISGLVGIHQFVRVGRYAFIQGLATVVQDVPPFMIASGVPARIRALNIEGLKRRDTPRETINALKEVFRLIYRSDLNRSQAVREIQQSGSTRIVEVDVVVQFLLNSQQGHLGRTQDRRHAPVVRSPSGAAPPPPAPGDVGEDLDAKASD